MLDTFKAKAIAQFTADLDKLVDSLAEELRTQLSAEHTETISDTLLGKRKKLAETEEVMAEKGMTLEEIKIHNAEAEGWNSSRRQLRKRLLGIEEMPNEAFGIEPAVIEAPVVPAEVVTEPVIPE